MLAVVEDEEHPLELQVFVEPVQEGIRGATQSSGRHPQGPGHGRRQQGRILDWPHVHQPDAVGEGIEDAGHRLQGEARLAAPADAGEGDEARRIEQVPHLLQFSDPANEGGEGGGEVVPASAGGAQGGEGGGEVGMGNLEHPLRPREVGKGMLAQVDEGNLGGEVVLEEVGGGVRAEHLAPEAQ